MGREDAEAISLLSDETVFCTGLPLYWSIRIILGYFSNAYMDRVAMDSPVLIKNQKFN